jgi:DNA-directed RNA polymerase subunit RPC12/RpoP
VVQEGRVFVKLKTLKTLKNKWHKIWEKIEDSCVNELIAWYELETGEHYEIKEKDNTIICPNCGRKIRKERIIDEKLD